MSVKVKTTAQKKKTTHKVTISRVDDKIRKDPLYKMDKASIIHKEHTYRGIAIASILVLYCVILFVVYIGFNYNIMFFPKI